MDQPNLPGTAYHPVLLHPPQRPVNRTAVSPGIAIILWTLGCMSLSLICWGAYQARLPQPEKNLHGLATYNKVKSASAEEPELIPPPTPEPIDLVLDESPTPEPPQLPVLDETPAVA